MAEKDSSYQRDVKERTPRQYHPEYAGGRNDLPMGGERLTPVEQNHGAVKKEEPANVRRQKQ